MSETISEYVGVYDAEGGLIGEARYIVGHLLGRAECALCDVTHTWRRKPEWDAMVVRLGVPFRLLHRNEVDDELRAASTGGLPCILAKVDGEWCQLMGRAELDGLGGSVERFEAALARAACAAVPTVCA